MHSGSAEAFHRRASTVSFERTPRTTDRATPARGARSTASIHGRMAGGRPSLSSAGNPGAAALFRRVTTHPPMTKILVVDDSATMRRMVIASLRGLGAVSFDEAQSGLEAIERLSVGAVDLILLDLNMPDVHG